MSDRDPNIIDYVTLGATVAAANNAKRAAEASEASAAAIQAQNRLIQQQQDAVAAHELRREKLFHVSRMVREVKGIGLNLHNYILLRKQEDVMRQHDIRTATMQQREDKETCLMVESYFQTIHDHGNRLGWAKTYQGVLNTRTNAAAIQKLMVLQKVAAMPIGMNDRVFFGQMALVALVALGIGWFATGFFSFVGWAVGLIAAGLAFSASLKEHVGTGSLGDWTRKHYGNATPSNVAAKLADAKAALAHWPDAVKDPEAALKACKNTSPTFTRRQPLSKRRPFCVLKAWLLNP